MTAAIDRRRLLIGGGIGVGLIVAWAAWPRVYPVNLTAGPDERVFGAWLKIGTDGHVTVAVPQAEHGQGVYTVLPQIVADTLGADWRTVGVEAAPINPLYANPLGLRSLLEGVEDALPAGVIDEAARRAPAMLTGGSASVRMFEAACRHAGAAARTLLMKAAARRWGVAWSDCGVDAGFVVHGAERLRFADLAVAAATETLPDPLPADAPGTGRLIGRPVARIDAPAKADGSANFAGDIRLPDMVHAAIRQAPPGGRLTAMDRAAAARVRGVVAVIDRLDWVAVAAATWWAAERGLAALAPRFSFPDSPATTGSIDAALTAALDGPGTRMAQAGNVAAAFQGAHLVTAEYRAAPAMHAAIETTCATALWHGDTGRLELWLPTQAPATARGAAARALGIGPDAVTVHPMLVGGGFGDRIEPGAAAQAGVIAKALRRPVSLVWSRAEECRHDRVRPPAAARMAARLAPGGAILGWSARIAAPATGKALAKRLLPGLPTEVALGIGFAGDAYAVAGAVPPYRIPAFAIDHHQAVLPIETGHLRGGAHGYTAFFTECFIDELAQLAGTEALSYRIGMLGDDPRLARCLSVAASLGGWDGGGTGSGQGIACHAFRGSRVAVLAEARIESGRPVVDRLVAAVDCGRVIHPDIVRQQIEGGLIFGMAAALGASSGFAQGMPAVRSLAQLGLPILGDVPDITVEIIRSDEAPGGVGELGVPAVAPAIANALRAATGVRTRTLPLR